MRILKLQSFFFLFIFFAFAGTLFAAGTSGSLSGTVTDRSSGKSVENVSVTATDSGATYTATTDANGFYTFVGMSAGIYGVSFDRVGYQTMTHDGMVIAADAAVSLDVALSTEAYKVKGVTVTAYRDATTNPRQVMTDYGYSDKFIREVFPGPASLNIQTILGTLPGVVTATDNYFGSNTLHIRGGTGNDVGFAFDGVPTYETTTGTFDTGLASLGTGTFGATLVNGGTARTDFYVGAYPVQYGNFLSGYVNQVAQRGYGPPHGNLELQYGFWLDNGAHLPTLDAATQDVIAYQGQAFPNPVNVNLTFMGQDRKFHYYFNQITENGVNAVNGVGPFVPGADLKPLFDLGSNVVAAFNEPLRSTVINLNYDLDSRDELQLLLHEGFTTATYFGENPLMTALVPMPDEAIPQKNDLEKLEWHHRFDSGNVFSMRLWRYATDTWLNFFDSPFGSTAEWLGSWEKGAVAEYQVQANRQNLLNVGASYDYSNNHYWGALAMPDPHGSFFSSLLQQSFGVFQTTAGLEDHIGVGVPDTQTMAAWISDEWRPFPKFTLNAGLRWDRQNYLVPDSSKVDISPWIAPDDPSTPAIESHTVLTNHGLPFSLPGCNSSGMSSYCFDPGFMHPSFVMPRAGASYQISDTLTVKASYGKFFTYAPGRDVALIKTLALTNPYTGLPTGIPAALADKPAVYTIPGSRPEFGETTDISLEYALNDRSYVKVTPYIKHIRNPILYSLLPNGAFTQINAGTIESEGVEFLAKTENWHGLSGWLDYTYSKTIGSQLPVQTIDPVNLGEPAAIVASNANAIVPAPYDIPHVANLVLDYKVPGEKFEIAPNFSFQSGQAYGLGSMNLCDLAAFEGIGAGFPTCAGTPNPLNETTPDSLRFHSVLTGNLAVTYHVNQALDTTISIFNLWNSVQSYAPFTQSYFFTPSMFYTAKPSYDPLQGHYYNRFIPLLRQFVLTMKYNF